MEFLVKISTGHFVGEIRVSNLSHYKAAVKNMETISFMLMYAARNCTSVLFVIYLANQGRS